MFENIFTRHTVSDVNFINFINPNNKNCSAQLINI